MSLSHSLDGIISIILGNLFGIYLSIKRLETPSIDTKGSIKESTQFLDSIGTAEMGQELEKRVIAMTTATRQNMERETGISSSFDEDIRKYLQEALQEIRRGRNDGNHHK